MHVNLRSRLHPTNILAAFGWLDKYWTLIMAAVCGVLAGLVWSYAQRIH